MSEGLVNSSADMLSGVGADFFDGADTSVPDDSSIEAAAPEVEAPEVVEPQQDEPAEEATPEAEEPSQEEAAPVAEKPPVDELPDGVTRGKDRNGKPGLFLTPQRYEKFHGAHKAIEEFSTLIGERLTPESMDLRQKAYEGQERLYNDLLSGDPAAQGSVLNHFIEEGQRAMQEGSITSDPMVPLAKTFYETMREKAPDGWAQIRHMAAKDLVAELYGQARQGQSADLFRSAGWVAKELGLPYKKDVDMPTFFASSTPENPATILEKENEQLRSQLQERQTSTQAAQFTGWKSNTGQAVSKAILDEAIKPALSEYQKGLWEKNPDAFQKFVVEPLHKDVRDVIAKDARFSQRILVLDQQAKRASAQKRADLAEQIRSAFVSRAMLAAESLRTTALNRAAQTFKGQNDATIQRRQAAQNVRGPKGSSSPSQRSIVPQPPPAGSGGFATAESFYRDAKQLIG